LIRRAPAPPRALGALGDAIRTTGLIRPLFRSRGDPSQGLWRRSRLPFERAVILKRAARFTAGRFSIWTGKRGLTSKDHGITQRARTEPRSLPPTGSLLLRRTRAPRAPTGSSGACTPCEPRGAFACHGGRGFKDRDGISVPRDGMNFSA
jgi:hypothetical protein